VRGRARVPSVAGWLVSRLGASVVPCGRTATVRVRGLPHAVRALLARAWRASRLWQPIRRSIGRSGFRARSVVRWVRRVRSPRCLAGLTTTNGPIHHKGVGFRWRSLVRSLVAPCHRAADMCLLCPLVLKPVDMPVSYQICATVISPHARGHLSARPLMAILAVARPLMAILAPSRARPRVRHARSHDSRGMSESYIFGICAPTHLPPRAHASSSASRPHPLI